MCPLKDDLHFVIFDPETAEIVCSLWTTLRRPLRCNHHSCDMSSLMTNSLKFMQQMTLALSERDIVFVANTYCSPLIWKIVRKLKQVLKTFMSGIAQGHRHFMPFTGASFINDCLLQPILHVNNPLFQFVDITDPLLSNASLFCKFYSHRI